MLIPPHETWRISIKGQYRNAFLAIIAFYLSKAFAKLLIFCEIKHVSMHKKITKVILINQNTKKQHITIK